MEFNQNAFLSLERGKRYGDSASGARHLCRFNVHTTSRL